MQIAHQLNWNTKKQEVLNILIYSNIFQYPLTKKEIYDRGKLTPNELDYCLSILLNKGTIFLIENYYCLQNELDLVKRRIERNNRASRYMKVARIIAKIISNFPYIRGVFLSGSISKDCMDKESDIDFFIITAPKGLWISHLFCSVFRKTVLLNRSKYFCYNYLLDSEHLVINERSLYTAIELKTLVPLFGYQYYKNIINQNEWTSEYYPNYPLASTKDIMEGNTLVQKFFEWLFNNKLGDFFDKWLLGYSIRKRRRKFDPLLFEQANYYIDLQRHVAKSHIQGKYPKIMNEYFKEINRYSYIINNI